MNLRGLVLVVICLGIANAAAAHEILWGDLHAHSTYSYDAVQYEHCTLIPAQALSTCLARVDFVALTDHAENGAPGYCTGEKWTNTMLQEIAFQAAYSNVIVFPAFEYTKTAPPYPDGNGHKCIICRDCGHVPPRGYGQDVYVSPVDLWTYLDGTAASGNYFSIPHHTAKGSDIDYPGIDMSTDWNPGYVRADIQQLVEIYSRHGNSEMSGCEEPVNDFQPERSVAGALDRWLLPAHNPAYKLGILGSTDTHNGRPGDTIETTNNVQPRLGPYTGGLTAVLATNRSRSAIWQALQARHCYATSGARIILAFSATLGDQTGSMGDTLYHEADLNPGNAATVALQVSAIAEHPTQRIARVQLFKQRTCILDLATNAVGSLTLATIDLLTNNYGYYRVKVWQQATTITTNCPFERAWSSPIWIEPGMVPEPFCVGMAAGGLMLLYRRAQGTAQKAP